MGANGFETLTYEVKGHVVEIGLNRAAKRNAFNLQMLRDLSEAYTRYEEDEGLWCALLFAHGKHFTGGLDLGEVGPAVAAGSLLFEEDSVDPLDMYGRRRSKPVVIAVQGWCLTIGVELVLASDIRVAAEGTRFSQMEIKRGIMPFGGATLRFPQVAGWGNAMRYLLTADEFGAQEALRIGLVQEVVAPEALRTHAGALAQRVAQQAPLAVQASLRAARMAVEEGAEQAKRELMHEARALMESEDAREGLMSFLERRKANFQGK